jgi:tetratricopeptide (TPR) repeat protein
MCKKGIVAGIVMAGVVFCWAGNKCAAEDMKEVLKQARVLKKWYPEQAEAIYKKIIADKPGSDDELEAQRNLAHIYIFDKKEAEVQGIVNRLNTGFAKNPNQPAALYNIAETYEEYEKLYGKGESYESAKGVYQKITGGPYADKAKAAFARVKVAALIKAGKDGEAQAAYDKLGGDFAGNAALPKMLYNIAVEYEAAKRYEKAEGIYKNIIAKYPDSGDSHYALGSQKHLVLVCSATGRSGEAKAAMEKLFKDYTGRQELVVALYDIALEYEGGGKYQDAAEVYQKILPLDQKSMRGLKAPIDIPKSQILSYIDGGEDGKVMAAVEKLIADNPGHPYLAAAVSRIGEQYQKKAAKLEAQGNIGQAKDYTRKAAAIYEIAAMRLPDSTGYTKTSGIMKEFETATPKACSAAGDCYRKADEYEKSNRCYQKLVDVYPMFISAGSTLYMMGTNYEQMGKSGIISRTEADSKAKAVYEQLLAKYPNCKVAAAAQSRLLQQGGGK